MEIVGRELSISMAALIADNRELRRQLEELRAQRAEVPVAALAAGVVHALTEANQALSAGDQAHRYVVSDVTAEIVCSVGISAQTLLVALPTAQHPLPRRGGRLEIAVRQIPTLPD